MSIARQLYQLQEVDLELEANERTLNQITSQLGASQAVARVQAKLNSEYERLEELKPQQHSTEWEMDDLTNKVTTAEQKLYSGTITNPKELANLQQDVEMLKANRARLEEKVLDIMEQVEQAEANVATNGAELRKLETEWQKQQQQLSTEMKQVKARLSDLRYQQQQLSANIDSQMVSFYHRLRNQRGTAVAKVEQGRCNSCRISLSTAKLQQVRSGSQVQCSNCGRILFLA